MKNAKEGDWVKLPNGSVGVIEKFTQDGSAYVRVPSLDGYPFPKWVLANVADLKKTRRPRAKVEIGNFEEAPF